MNKTFLLATLSSICGVSTILVLRLLMLGVDPSTFGSLIALMAQSGTMVCSMLQKSDVQKKERSIEETVKKVLQESQDKTDTERESERKQDRDQ